MRCEAWKEPALPKWRSTPEAEAPKVETDKDPPAPGPNWRSAEDEGDEREDAAVLYADGAGPSAWKGIRSPGAGAMRSLVLGCLQAPRKRRRASHRTPT